ncbi:outer membrane cobalamin receptor [Algoriphagus sp. 4150]|uniref:TonB-dependent receptor n=1 Tax=Algoriphagus sp. 4150 TaxID=2817756 RepID=UPI00285E6EA6|nr:TonB-dependent receptor [Algoriphagus sp. 4150]MDR7130925.1 outer membrane cobalamin receptor [Algoriphagus sp. 4150]
MKLLISFRISMLWVILLVLGGVAKAQTSTFTITGKVLDQTGSPVPFANLKVLDSSQGTLANLDGTFSISGLSAKSYSITISSIGYRSKTYLIDVEKNTQTDFILVASENTLEMVQVTERQIKSDSEIIREAGFNVSSIETGQFENLSVDLNQVLRNAAGIRIKESGGMGSAYNLSLNGLSDRQVRIFVDEVPVDQLGSGFNLNNLPVNMIERIDVYKGVVPVKLGADALGGSINIVTRQDVDTFLDASYSTGSFNTHQAVLNGQYRNGGGFTFKASGYYNYSDNDYRMKSMSVFREGKETFVDIRRFHDQYQAYMGNVEAGFTQTKWADQLLAGVSVATIDQDIQGINSKPVGEAEESERNRNYTLKYSKREFFSPKLGLNVFALYNEINSTSIDTSSNRYDWSGQIVRTERNNLGEMVREKTIFEYEQSHFLNRIFLDYRFNEHHTLSFNQLFSSISRQGENRLSTNNNQPFRSPNDIRQVVSGLEYEINAMDQKLRATFALKNYNLYLLARNAIQYQAGQFEIEDIETDQNRWGYAAAGRYFLRPDWSVKGSFEKGYRLPQPREIFGDGLQIIANPQLQPESSLNVNLGMAYRIKINRHVLRSDANFFMRDVDNFVFLRQEGVFSRYTNVLGVLIRGFEWEGHYQYAQKLTLQANLTYQNVLNNEKYVAGTRNPSLVYRDRMPNTPFLFANTQLTYLFAGLFTGADLSLYHSINYVHEYFLNYPSVAITSTKNIVPVQLLNNVGVTLSDINRTYNVSLEARNIFDKAAYDNFNQQKPGRAFFLKIRYYFSKNSLIN